MDERMATTTSRTIVDRARTSTPFFACGRRAAPRARAQPPPASWPVMMEATLMEDHTFEGEVKKSLEN
jgi:hypothetical protein